MLRALAPLPAIAVQLMSLLDDPEVSLQRVADLAARDVGIAASILRMANSPIFGRPLHVGNIGDALRLIGTVQARRLVLACGVAQIGQKELPLYGMAADDFLRHSELVATLAANIARRVKCADPGTAYSAGLLHDIGKVALNGLAQQHRIGGSRHERFAEALQAPDATVTGVERAFFGTDHTAIGRDLATIWDLPIDLGKAIRFHHPATVPMDTAGTPLISCLALANAVAGAADPLYPEANRAPMPATLIIPVEEAVRFAESLRHRELVEVRPDASTPMSHGLAWAARG